MVGNNNTTASLLAVNKSLRRFVNSMHSKATIQTYLNSVKLYMQYHDIKDHDSLLKIDRDTTFEMIEDFIEYLRKEKERSLSRITCYLSAIRLFYSVNRYDTLDWYTLNRFKGKERKKMVNDRCYTREEIHMLLEHADLRMKVAILTMTSSGVRVGGLALMRVGDLEYIEEYKLYRMHVYSEDIDDKYYTYCTPECAKFIDTYLETRKRQFGESITEDSPLIRKDTILAKNPFVKPRSIQERLRVITLNAGIRKTNKIKKGIDDPVEIRRIRTEIMNCHGLRKFFDTVCVDSEDMKHIPKEIMMGHKKEQGLDRNYYRPTSDKLLNEYLKVVDDLTINNEHRLSKKVQELQEKNQDKDYIIKGKLQEKDDEIKGMKEQINEMNKKFEHVFSMIQQNPLLAQIKPEVLTEF
jgi:integrase